MILQGTPEDYNKFHSNNKDAEDIQRVRGEIKYSRYKTG